MCVENGNSTLGTFLYVSERSTISYVCTFDSFYNTIKVFDVNFRLIACSENTMGLQFRILFDIKFNFRSFKMKFILFHLKIEIILLNE